MIQVNEPFRGVGTLDIGRQRLPEGSDVIHREEPGSTEVDIPAGGMHLRGDLSLLPGARALVFLVLSSSSRINEAHRIASGHFQRPGLSTPTLDCPSEDERRDRHNRLDDGLHGRACRSFHRYLDEHSGPALGCDAPSGHRNHHHRVHHGI